MISFTIMPFVKLDCDILTSSLWPEKVMRDVFLTALLLAEPYEIREAEPQLFVRQLKPAGWSVPPGWYGIIRGASAGIIHHAMVGKDEGLRALEALGEPDPDSRSEEYDGRRMVRVNGGYIVLNYDRYRERDYSSAERQKRYRERQKLQAAEAKAAAEDVGKETAAKKRANGGTIRTKHLDPISQVLGGPLRKPHHRLAPHGE